MYVCVRNSDELSSSMGFNMYGESEVEIDMSGTPPEITQKDLIAIYAGSVTGMYVCMYVRISVCM